MSDTVKELLLLEAAEQATWGTSIPAWHPMNVGGAPGEGGGGEGGGAGEGAAGGEEAGSGDPDVAALIQGLGNDFGSRFDALSERLDSFEQGDDDGEGDGDEDEGAELLPVFTESDFDERGELSLEAQTREIQKLVQRQVDAALTPQREQAAQERRDAYTDALEERYPDLQDPEKQEQYINATIEFARAIGRPELAIEPELLERVYLSERAKEQAAGEIPAGSQREVTLERGSGAGPAAAATDDRAKKIVSAVNGQQFRLGRAKS